MGTPFLLSYPKQSSSIFYIGSSTNLKNRLASHGKTGKKGNFLLDRMLQAGLDVFCSWLSFPDYSVEQIRSIEFNAFVSFGIEYGLALYGNRIPPEADPIEITISFKEHLLSEHCVSPENMAKKLDLLYELDPYPVVDTDVLNVFDSQSNEIFSGNFRMKPKSTRKKRN